VGVLIYAHRLTADDVLRLGAVIAGDVAVYGAQGSPLAADRRLASLLNEDAWRRVRQGEVVFLLTDGSFNSALVPLWDHAGRLAAALQIAEDRSEAIAAFRQTSVLAILLILVTVISGFIMAQVTAIVVSQRLAPLLQATTAMQRGDFTTRVVTGPMDEVERVASQFNQMAEGLERIFARTAALYDIIQQSIQASTTDELMANLTKALASSLHAQACAIFLCNGPSKELRLRAYYGVAASFAENPAILHILTHQSILGRLLADDRPLIFEDLSSFNRHLMRPFLDAGIRAVVYVPLQVRRQFQGVLLIGHGTPQRYQSEDLAFLSVVGEQVGQALEKMALYEEAQARARDLERQAYRLAVLNQIANVINSTLPQDEILTAVAQEMTRVFGVQQVGIVLYDEERGVRRVVTQYRVDGPPTALGREVPSPALAEGNVYIHEMRRPLCIKDAQHDPRISRLHGLMREQGIVSIMLIPLIAGDKGIGSIGLDVMDAPRCFTDEEAELAQTIANQVAIAIMNARLREEQAQALARAERRAREMELLHHISATVVAARSLPEVYRAVVDGLSASFGYRMVSIYVCADGMIRLASQRGYRSVPSEMPITRGIVGRVARTGEAAFVPQVAQDPDYIEVDPEVRSEICVPLKQGNEVLGVLNVETDAGHPLDEGDLGLLLTLSQQIVAAMENARLMEEQERLLLEEHKRIRDLSIMNEVSALISSQFLDVDALLQTIANHMARVVDGTGAFVSLWDEEEKRLIPMAAYGTFTPVYRTIRLPPGEPSIARLVAEERRPIAIRDVFTSPYVSRYVSCLFPDKSILGIPLLVQDTLVGVAILGDNRQHRDFSSEEIERALIMGRQVAVTLQHARLYQKAQRTTQEMVTLSAIARKLTAIPQDLTVWMSILEDLATIIPHEVSSLYAYDDTRATLQLVAFRGIDEETARILEATAWERQPGEALRQRRVIVAGTARKEYELPPPLVASEPWSVVCVPIISGESRLGVLVMAAKPPATPIPQSTPEGAAEATIPVGPPVFTQHHIRLALAVADQLAVALANWQLYWHLQESEQKYRKLVEEASDPIWIINPLDMTIMDVNRRGEALINSPRARLVGQPVTLLIPALGEDRLSPVISRAYAQGTASAYELSLPTADGLTVPVAVTASRVVLGGRPVVVVVTRDITHFVELDRLKSEFVAAVSHELRTPLGSIIGFAELLQSGQPGPLTPEQREFVSIIHEDALRLHHLVDDLLDVSRLESGHLRLTIGLLNLGELLVHLVGAVRPMAQQRGIEIICTVEDGLPLVQADGQRTEQVVNNLLSNAIKFTPDGGRITVWARRTDGFVEVSVEDTGLGIPPEDLPHIFSKFFRTSQASRRAIKGTGLGLYISKAIVEQSGGRMGVESEPNKGTRFWFTLPIAPTR